MPAELDDLSFGAHRFDHRVPSSLHGKAWDACATNYGDGGMRRAGDLGQSTSWGTFGGAVRDWDRISKF